MRRPAPVLLAPVLLAAGLCLLLPMAPVGAEDDTRTPRPDLRALSPSALVRHWIEGAALERARAEVELRRRGVRMVHAVRAALASAAPRDRRGLDRLRGALVEAYHRRHIPPGMVYVPAGPVEVPRTQRPFGPSGKRAPVAAFYLDRTEVTVAAWRRWLAVRGGPARKTGRSLLVPPDDLPGTLPVNRVTHAEATLYATEARGGRLPRSEEFERAVRGSGVSNWPWGMQYRAKAAWLERDRESRPVAVGSFPKVGGPFGALDLVGNVAEWTSTVRQAGRSARSRKALLFGGSYRDLPVLDLTWRSPGRAASIGHSRRPEIGFRVARDVPALPPAPRGP